MMTLGKYHYLVCNMLKTCVVYIVSTMLTNLVSLELFHHNLMGMYDYGLHYHTLSLKGNEP